MAWLVDMLFLDSNWPMKRGSAQYAWLEGELAGSTAPWKFVVCHHPPFTSGPHGKEGRDGTPKEAPIRELREYVIPLLEKHGVTMVFTGHDHLYERSEKGGITYITTGGGGGPLRGTEGGENQNPGVRYCNAVYQAIETGQEAEMSAALQQRADAPDAPGWLKALALALQAILRGSRDPSLADDPALDYDDAAEVQLLLERVGRDHG